MTLTVRRLSFLVFAVAFALRVAAAAALGVGAADTSVGGYWFFNVIASNVLAGKGFLLDTHFQTYANVMPLYPALLAAMRWITASMGMGTSAWPLAVVQAAVGAATAVVVCRLADLLFGRRAALLAGAMAALYPYYVGHDTRLQETSLFTFLTVSAVYALLRADGAPPSEPRLRSAGLAGVLLGLAILTRASLAPFAALAVFWLAVAFRPEARRASMTRGVAAAVALACVVGPWIVRNERVVGAPMLTSQTGFFLWLAQNDKTFARYPEESIDVTLREALAATTAEERASYAEAVAVERSELARMRWFEARGRAYLVAHKEAAVVGAARKIAAGFSPVMSPRRPVRPWVLAAHALSYTPVALLAIAGVVLARHRRRELVLFGLLFGTFVVASGVFWAHTSHRVYLDAYLIVFAGFALAQAYEKRASRDRRRLRSS